MSNKLYRLFVYNNAFFAAVMAVGGLAVLACIFMGFYVAHQDSYFRAKCEAAGGVVSGDGCFRRDVFVGPSIQGMYPSYDDE